MENIFVPGIGYVTLDLTCINSLWTLEHDLELPDKDKYTNLHLRIFLRAGGLRLIHVAFDKEISEKLPAKHVKTAVLVNPGIDPLRTRQELADGLYRLSHALNTNMIGDHMFVEECLMRLPAVNL